MRHQKANLVHMRIQLKPMDARLLSDEVYQHIPHGVNNNLLGGWAALQMRQNIRPHGILPTGYAVQGTQLLQ